MGREFKRGSELGRLRVAGLVENAANDLDQLKLEKVEVKEVIGIEDLDGKSAMAKPKNRDEVNWCV